MTHHYKFGGSTAKRTMNCPAWIQESEGVPSAPASSAATLGTALHVLIERSLDDEDYDAADAIGETIEGVTITAAHIVDKIYPALDEFEDLIEDYDLTFVVEATMEINDETGGTVDFIGWNAEKNVIVCADYKSGDGIIVDAEGNDQLIFYVILALAKIDMEFVADEKTKFILAIIQPSERRDEVLDTWEIDLAGLNAWSDEFGKAIELANQKTDPKPGNWCKFCPAEATCPAKTGAAQNALRLKTDGMQLEALNTAMAIVGDIENWAKAVRKLAHEQAEQGVKIKGWKLVNKRASRVWNEPGEIKNTLKKMRSLSMDDYLVMDLKTPPALEKICKIKGVDFSKFKGYISKVSSGTTMAPESDTRPEAVAVPALKALADRLK